MCSCWGWFWFSCYPFKVDTQTWWRFSSGKAAVHCKNYTKYKISVCPKFLPLVLLTCIVTELFESYCSWWQRKYSCLSIYSELYIVCLFCLHSIFVQFRVFERRQCRSQMVQYPAETCLKFKYIYIYNLPCVIDVNEFPLK